MTKEELKKQQVRSCIVIGILILVLCFISFFMGYGAGMSDPEPKETRELEKEIKIEELKKLKLDNQLKELSLSETK